MGFFDKLTESASTTFNKEVEALLLPGEAVEESIKLVSDYFVFTSKRIIFVDAKFMSSKRAVISIPYSKISEVAMSTGGMMSFSQEIAIQVGSVQHEVKLYDPKQSITLYNKIVAKIS